MPRAGDSLAPWLSAQVNEQGKADGDGRDQETLENEDRADEGEDDDMPPSYWHRTAQPGSLDEKSSSDASDPCRIMSPKIMFCAALRQLCADTSTMPLPNMPLPKMTIAPKIRCLLHNFFHYG